MAVIGSRDNLNRDPKNLQATYLHQTTLFIVTNNTGSNSSGADFWSNNLATKNTADVASGVAFTVVDISGGAGYLTNIICPVSSINVNRDYLIKVTIDGAETPLFYETNGWTSSQVVDSTRLVLGFINPLDDAAPQANSRYGNTAMPSDLSSQTNAAWNTDHNWVCTRGVKNYSLPSPSQLRSTHPQACVRFETSLKVEITCSFNNTSADQKNSGVIYILDAPAS